MQIHRQWVVSTATMHADKSMGVMMTAQHGRNAQTISKNKVSLHIIIHYLTKSRF